MRLSIIPLRCTDITSLLAMNVQHPLIGEFLDSGTYASVNPARINSSAPTIIEDIRTSLPSVAEDAGVAVDSFSGLPVMSLNEHGIFVMEAVPKLETATEVLESCYEELAEGGAISLILADEWQPLPALVVICAYDMPSMGKVAPCSLADVFTTWVRIAGGDISLGQFLLEERGSSMHATDEEALTARMRQLYGQ